MTTFDMDEKEITTFDIDDTFLSKEYFDQNDLFNQLKEYYNSDMCQFEMPEDNLKKVRQILERFFYKLRVVNDPIQYCVLVKQDTNTTELLRNLVLRIQRGSYEIFFIKDKLSMNMTAGRSISRLKETVIETRQLTWRIDRS